MRYLLDTNAASGLIKNSPSIVSRMRLRSPDEVAVSAIVMSELWFGAFKSPKSSMFVEILRSLKLVVLDFDRDDARCAGEVRNALRISGTPIGPYDTLIAGQALARDLTLVTHNTREFSRVAGLRLEDWEA